MRVDRINAAGNVVGTWEQGDCALVLAHVTEDSDGRTVSVQIGEIHLVLATEYTVAVSGFPHDKVSRPITHKRIKGLDR